MRSTVMQRTTKVIAIIMMAIFMITMVPQTEKVVYADSGDPAMVIGADVISKGVNSAGAQVLKYGRREWYVISYNGAGNSALAQTGIATLLHQGVGEYVIFNQDETKGNAYAGSDLEAFINNIISSFTANEQASIQKRELEGGSANYDQDGYDKNKIKGNSVTESLWPLSYAEAENLSLELRRLNGIDWWLRSPGEHDENAASVFQYGGTIQYRGYNVSNSRYGVRPAFNLDLTNILLTSASTGGKSTGAIGADALTAVGTNSNREWKVTLKDSGHKGFALVPCGTTYDSDTGEVTIAYTGAKTGTNEYISAITADSAGNIKYYGRIGAASSADDASVTINLKDKLGSSDKLYLFNEQYNGDGQTDYASELLEIEIPPKGHDWEFTGFDWTGSEKDGYTVATADYVCKTESSHTTTAEAKITTEVTEPTCTEGGKTTYTATVNAADSPDEVEHTESKDAQPTEAKGHTAGEKVIEKEIAPTCEEDGSYDEVIYCTVCEEELSRETITVPAIGHEWEFAGFNWTGSEEDGYTTVTATYVCKNDDTHTTATEAEIDSEATEPTCTEGGKTTYTATVTAADSPDGAEHTETKDAQPTDAKGHTPGEAVIEKEIAPTCEEDGSYDEVVYCTVCEEELNRETVVVPAIGHDWEFTGFVWNGSEEDGYTSVIANYTCKNDDSHTTTAEAVITTEVTDPTCMEGGKTTYTATVTATDSPDKTEHTETKDAQPTDAKGHTPGDTVIENVIAPTCTEDGSHDEVVYCTVCKEELTRKAIVDPAIGHDWDTPTYTWSDDNSAVTAKRICKNDSTHQETETVSTTEKVTKEPTYEAAGEKTITATFENAAFTTQTKTIAIPAKEKGVYKITDGANGIWTKKSGKTLQFTAKRSSDDETTFSHFTGILIDGKDVSKDNYSAKSGSVIIDFKASYLETLAVGKHTMAVQFEDGDDATTEFTVKAASAPANKGEKKSNNVNTGDNTQMGIWIVLAGMSLVAITIIVTRSRRIRRAG